jgi:endogenous inhibitor of DNA gyrase (YacG/DUF329 family)
MPDSRLCVLCRERPAESRWRPFCSERCRMADLGRWLSGDYRVAAGDPHDPDSVTTPDDVEDADRRHR